MSKEHEHEKNQRSSPHFAEEMKEWLGVYREEILGRGEMGAWQGKPYRHILAQEDAAEWNYLPEIRMQILRYLERNPFKPHKYFAHLNSSQALALNLFYPLLPREVSGLKWGNPSQITEILKLDGLYLCSTAFELVLDAAEMTNFDWAAETSDGGRILCEVKYTESSFGSATSRTTNYESRYRNLYLPKLRGLTSVVRSPETDLAWFKKHYQILRNLSFLNSGKNPAGNRILFVLPRRSSSYLPLARFLDSELTAEARSKVKILELADWVKILKERAASEEEERHWSSFQQKYLPNANSA